MFSQLQNSKKSTCFISKKDNDLINQWYNSAARLCDIFLNENRTDRKLLSTIPIPQSLTTLKWSCAAIINITLLRLCYYVPRRGRVGRSCGCSAWWPLWCGRAGWHCSEPPHHRLLRSAIHREREEKKSKKENTQAILLLNQKHSGSRAV